MNVIQRAVHRKVQMHQSMNATSSDGEINDLSGQSPVMHDRFPSLEAPSWNHQGGF